MLVVIRSRVERSIRALCGMIFSLLPQIGSMTWKILFVLIHRRFSGVLAWLYARVIEERLPDGTLRRPAGPSRDGRITILALTPHMFRGDLHFLAASGEVRVLQLPEHWQNRLIYQFHPEGGRRWQYANPDPGELALRCKQRYRRFLRGFLPPLYRKLGVSCVLAHHVHNSSNVDWGEVSDELGFPFIVLHRECLIAPLFRNKVKARIARLGRFEGSHIVVHNQAARELLVDSGFVEPDRISSLGCIRIDNFLKRIAAAEPRSSGRKKVAFFPFVIGGKRAELDEALFPFFRDVHVTLARLAIEHPELDVVMKSKLDRSFDSRWRQTVQRAFDEAGICPDDIPNLQLRSDIDAQDLILDSDVVCGLNSTTVIEAGIAGKPVVIPYFGLLRDPKYDERLRVRDGFRSFDVATSREGFEALILERLDNPVIDREAMEGRSALCERHLSRMEGNATEKYLGLIKRIVAQGSAAGRHQSRGGGPQRKPSIRRQRTPLREFLR